MYLAPVFQFIFDTGYFHVSFNIQQIVGMIIIIVSNLISIYYEIKTLREKEAAEKLAKTQSEQEMSESQAQLIVKKA